MNRKVIDDSAPFTHTIAYIAQVRMECKVSLNDLGEVVNSEPLFQAFKGRSIEDIKRSKLITGIKEIPKPGKESGLVITDAV